MWLIFSRQIFSTTLILFLVLKVKFSVAEIVERIFLITIFEDVILILKFGNIKLIESIFPEKISHDL